MMNDDRAGEPVMNDVRLDSIYHWFASPVIIHHSSFP
jgi:hypothetical protein